MRPIKSIVVKNMSMITLFMVISILILSTVVQMISMQQVSSQNALQIFGQVEQILDENSRELERIQDEYEVMCLNDARAVAYILAYNPSAKDDVRELRKIAADVEVDEIHIFDKSGMIVAGTHPEYFGLTFDSGEQIGFFKPLLEDKSLELVQEVMPNTAEGKQVQYSALWSEDGEFIVQVGMDPTNVLRATSKNELSYIFSLLRTNVGYSLYAIDCDTKKVVGSTVITDVDKDMEELGFEEEELKAGQAFYAEPDRTKSYCFSKEIGGDYIIWATPVTSFYSSILSNEVLLFDGIVLMAVILVYAVTHTMNKAVIGPIERINKDLRAIQEGDLKTRVGVKESKEFLELSTHINKMVESLLQNLEELRISEEIRDQNEELEKRHGQMETAVERAEAASKAKSIFLFNMSHDIRTPMNAILGFTNLALESNDLETQRKYLENIDISSKQLLDLMDNILEYSRLENRKVMIEEDLVDVKEVFSKLRTIFDSDLKKKHLTYTTDLDIEHPYMYMDRIHYTQIFLNIVGNSIKYTSDGGRIDVSFREKPGEHPDSCFVETVIADNGIGMSSEFLLHVYESFSRERTSTVSGIQGTGLGLTIVKELVSLMEGTIHIESRPGKGTKVTVCLPHRLGERPAEEEIQESGALDHTLFEGKHILLAEDIDINAMIAMKLLSSKGCIVDRAKDGVECVDMLLKAEEGYYDLILMDIQMPNMDGYKATQTIRALEDEKRASIPILALTANALKEDRDKAAEVGMDAHIAKPIDAAKMFMSIAETLQKLEKKENKKR